MKKARNKPTKAGAVELTEDELGQVAGGLKLENAIVTSYSLSAGSGSELDPATPDPDLSSPTPKR